MIEGIGHLVEWRSVEDWLPQLISDALPSSVRVTSRLVDGQPYPFVLVREVPLIGAPPVEHEHVELKDVEVHAFADGVDAQSDAYMLASACVTVLRGLVGRLVGPREKVVAVRLDEPAARRTDWADSTTTVQYQDLPMGVERFRVQVRLKMGRRNREEV